MAAIYKILNFKTNQCYIGSAVFPDKRWKEHQKFLKANKHHSRHLQNAWNKYSSWFFKFEIVEVVENINKLIEREQFWIDNLNPEYNIRKIANSQLGLKRTDEARLNMRLSRLGKKHSEETKIKIGLAAKGNKSRTGQKLTDDQKRILRLGKKRSRTEINALLSFGC